MLYGCGTEHHPAPSLTTSYSGHLGDDLNARKNQQSSLYTQGMRETNAWCRTPSEKGWLVSLPAKGYCQPWERGKNCVYSAKMDGGIRWILHSLSWKIRSWFGKNEERTKTMCKQFGKPTAWIVYCQPIFCHIHGHTNQPTFRCFVAGDLRVANGEHFCYGVSKCAKNVQKIHIFWNMWVFLWII